MRCFFFNDTATTEIYTLPYTTLFRSGTEPGRRTSPLDDLQEHRLDESRLLRGAVQLRADPECREPDLLVRSEEHTSELQSRQYLVCRLLLEKKNPSSPSLSFSFLSMT